MLQPADRDLAARDPSIPGLALALDPKGIAAIIGRHVPALTVHSLQINYVRYKPHSSCLIGIEADTAEGTRRFSCRAAALAADVKWADARKHAHTLIDDDVRIVIRSLWHDTEVCGARWLFDSERVRRVPPRLGLQNATLDIVAYKPERRLVVRASRDGIPFAAIKCHTERAYMGAVEALRVLADHNSALGALPAIWDDRRQIIASPWINGSVLNIAKDSLDDVRRVGQKLARLHGVPLSLPRETPAEDEHASVVRIARDVAWYLPDITNTLELLVAQLHALRSHPKADACVTTLHGDFYAKQILLHEGNVIILDFDELGMGDPHIDVALFLAHVERDVLRGSCTRERADAVREALCAGYSLHRPLNEVQLAWRTAESLLRLTPHPFRHRHSDWPALTRAMVARCETLLNAVPPASRAREAKAPLSHTSCSGGNTVRA